MEWKFIRNAKKGDGSKDLVEIDKSNYTQTRIQEKVQKSLLSKLITYMINKDIMQNQNKNVMETSWI